jgi:uncharacterized protein YuzE
MCTKSYLSSSPRTKLTGNPMKGRYLEVTFRKGKPLAAYLYLPREAGVKSARTIEGAPGILVDYSEDGAPIGLEITAPTLVTLEEINTVLARVGQPPVGEEEMAPLRAA